MVTENEINQHLTPSPPQKKKKKTFTCVGIIVLPTREPINDNISFDGKMFTRILVICNNPRKVLTTSTLILQND